MTMISSIYDTGKGFKDFIDVRVIAFKKTNPTKCSDHHTISLIAHTANVVARILRSSIEKKIEDVLGEDQFGFRRGKGTRITTEMLITISEQSLDIDEELSACFRDWQKPFFRVKWTKAHSEGNW
jgi:hypothetical protein